MQSNESFQSNPTPAARYEVSPEVKVWIDENYSRWFDEDATMPHEEWQKLEAERVQRTAKSREFELEWLRRGKSILSSSRIERLEEELLEQQKKREAQDLETQQEAVESKFPKNILTHYDDTLRAISLIEGEGWTWCQETEGQTMHSARNAIVLWNRDHKDPSAADTSLFTIYGSGGFNRYFVYTDGSVKFSAGHGSKKDGERASRLGFKIV